MYQPRGMGSKPAALEVSHQRKRQSMILSERSLGRNRMEDQFTDCSDRDAEVAEGEAMDAKVPALEAKAVEKEAPTVWKPQPGDGGLGFQIAAEIDGVDFLGADLKSTHLRVEERFAVPDLAKSAGGDIAITEGDARRVRNRLPLPSLPAAPAEARRSRRPSRGSKKPSERRRNTPTENARFHRGRSIIDSSSVSSERWEGHRCRARQCPILNRRRDGH